MMSLLKFIMVLVLLYWLVRLMYQVLVPAPIRQMISQIRQGMQQGAASATPEQRPEGTVTIVEPKQKNSSPSAARAEEGEYVDWEELKD